MDVSHYFKETLFRGQNFLILSTFVFALSTKVFNVFSCLKNVEVEFTFFHIERSLR